MKIKSIKKSNTIYDKLQCYVITFEDSNIVRSVPPDEDNMDYQEILKWVADGNTIEEAD
tara:strand:+ start:1314 stop:1490 length:177 start_codon:yes stop_codon:yes gene_type:complete